MIRIEGIGKRYRLGGNRAKYLSLREEISQSVKRLTRRNGRIPNEFWALRKVSFDVAQGEAVGIIGRNGAGKSTLLKVLSRITPPTEGQIHLDGRVASLLEVGTGFHPELTGRENIYLNGSILGMTRREIAAKFDEIVEFSEIEKFLDTPVKRYSSGMYVRLAFAVAAHLEPEILIVDEVLAVGDAQFQSKCLGKMQDVASGGRTVLFVSHNMAAVESLCHRAVMLDQGSVVYDGPAAEGVNRYLADGLRRATIDLRDRVDRAGDGSAKIVAIRITPQDEADGVVRIGDMVRIDVSYEAKDRLSAPIIHVSIMNERGAHIYQLESCLVPDMPATAPARATYSVVCGPLLAMPGVYTINAAVIASGMLCDHVVSAASMEVLPADFFGTGRLPAGNHGVTLLAQQWRLFPESVLSAPGPVGADPG